jgi:hypothetical protein
MIVEVIREERSNKKIEADVLCRQRKMHAPKLCLDQICMGSLQEDHAT